MSVHRHHGAWQVRWREGAQQHGRVFARKGDARAFDLDVKRRKSFGRGVLLTQYAEAIEQRAIDGVALDDPPSHTSRRPLLDPAYVVRPGITYAVSSEPYDGWVKLGRCANDPQERLGQLQTGNPRPLVFRALWPIDAETALHGSYHEFRGCGEWFALPLELLRDMAALAETPEPHRALFEDWTVGRVWSCAGGRDGRSATTLAHVFAASEIKARATA